MCWTSCQNKSLCGSKTWRSSHRTWEESTTYPSTKCRMCVTWKRRCLGAVILMMKICRSRPSQSSCSMCKSKWIRRCLSRIRSIASLATISVIGTDIDRRYGSQSLRKTSMIWFRQAERTQIWALSSPTRAFAFQSIKWQEKLWYLTSSSLK